MGGEVHEMGVMLLVGIPVPYVDATASTAFQGRWQRAAVGAAGVITELFVAALALFVWVSVEPGLARAIAFNTVVIASVSVSAATATAWALRTSSKTSGLRFCGMIDDPVVMSSGKATNANSSV